MELITMLETDDDSSFYITYKDKTEKIDVQKPDLIFSVDNEEECILFIEQKPISKSMNLFIILIYILTSFIQAPFYALLIVDKDYFFKNMKPYCISAKFTFNIHKTKRIKILYNSSIYDEVMKKWIKPKISIIDVITYVIDDIDIKYHINHYAFNRVVFHYFRILTAIGIFLEFLFIIILFKAIRIENTVLSSFLLLLCIITVVSISIAIISFNKKSKFLYKKFMSENELSK